jgi:hypothetical protein
MGTSNIKGELPAGGVILSVPHSALISSRGLAAENSRFIAATTDVYRGEILGQIKDHNHPLDFS